VKRETKYNSQNWIFENDDDSLHALRKLLGLPPISYQQVPCKRCASEMKSQFNGSVRIDWFCHYCRHYVASQCIV
jgi:hypothetical protein